MDEMCYLFIMIKISDCSMNLLSVQPYSIQCQQGIIIIASGINALTIVVFDAYNFIWHIKWDYIYWYVWRMLWVVGCLVNIPF